MFEKGKKFFFVWDLHAPTNPWETERQEEQTEGQNGPIQMKKTDRKTVKPTADR